MPQLSGSDIRGAGLPRRARPEFDDRSESGIRQVPSPVIPKNLVHIESIHVVALSLLTFHSYARSASSRFCLLLILLLDSVRVAIDELGNLPVHKAKSGWSVMGILPFDDEICTHVGNRLQVSLLPGGVTGYTEDSCLTLKVKDLGSQRAPRRSWNAPKLSKWVPLACFIRERAMRGEVESFCAPLRQVAPGWRRL